MERRERGLQPGDPHRGHLERLLLLLARVGGVVGPHGVERARPEGVDQRSPVLLRAKRRGYLVDCLARTGRGGGGGEVGGGGLRGGARGPAPPPPPPPPP